MKLKLVKQGEFLGTRCDFYVDEENNIYMSRTQTVSYTHLTLPTILLV